MPDQRGLQKSNKERTNRSYEKAREAIISLKSKNKQINFSSVSQESGVSRPFLYNNAEIRSLIEEARKCDVNNEINKRAKFDKTSKSKDVVISAKDKKIAELEEENKKLKKELSILRGMIYESKNITSNTCKRREECSDSGG